MSRVLGMLRLQDHLLKQACEDVKTLEHELALAHAHIQFLEAKLQKLSKRASLDSYQLPALLKRQAE